MPEKMEYGALERDLARLVQERVRTAVMSVVQLADGKAQKFTVTQAASSLALGLAAGAYAAWQELDEMDHIAMARGVLDLMETAARGDALQAKPPAAAIMDVLRKLRLSVAVEKTAQAEIHEALLIAGIEAEREVILDGANRIDLIAGNVGIEVKVKGSKRDILRQVQRYCEFERIGELILVTAVAMGVPPVINGKPVHIVSIGRAWL